MVVIHNGQISWITRLPDRLPKRAPIPTKQHDRAVLPLCALLLVDHSGAAHNKYLLQCIDGCDTQWSNIIEMLAYRLRVEPNTDSVPTTRASWTAALSSAFSRPLGCCTQQISVAVHRWL